jgi:hypothetical protein
MNSKDISWDEMERLYEDLPENSWPKRAVRDLASDVADKLEWIDKFCSSESNRLGNGRRIGT